MSMVLLPAPSSRTAPGPPLAPGLYIIATPIGNLGDISLRALETLRHCDAVLCEDSRISSRIFARHRIQPRPMILYHEHSPPSRRAAILAQLRQGAALALVSDAGTPMISDPGLKLVRAVLAQQTPLFTLPGPSALLAALALSGLAAESFAFAGFPPRKPAARRKWLQPFAAFPGALVFYEAPSRLAASLADMAAMLGEREAVLAREMTKRHEEIIRQPLSALVRAAARQAPPKGELTLVLGAPQKNLLQQTARRLRGRNAYRRGHRREALACAWLRLKGFSLVAKGWRSRAGEIDLIMRKKDLVIFVEVKARPSLAEAADALQPGQMRRLRRAAAHWLQANPALASSACRFDIVLFYGWRWQHLPDAWQ